MADIDPKKPDTAKNAEVIQGEGGGKAYESVAQSAAIAIQDATDHLRNINTISATAIAVAMAQALNPTAEGILELNSSITRLKKLANSPDFQVIGQHVAEVQKGVPQATGLDTQRNSGKQ